MRRTLPLLRGLTSVGFSLGILFEIGILQQRFSPINTGVDAHRLTKAGSFNIRLEILKPFNFSDLAAFSRTREIAANLENPSRRPSFALRGSVRSQMSQYADNFH